jgi:hypothetical protein
LLKDLAHGLVGDTLDHFQGYQPCRQEAQGPTLASLRWRGTGQGNQPRLLGAVEFAPVLPVGSLARQRRRQSGGGVSLPHACHGRQPDIQCCSNGRIRPARSRLPLVGFEQNAGMGEPPGRRGPLADER